MSEHQKNRRKTDRSPHPLMSDNPAVAAAFDDAALQRNDQHSEQMLGIGDIEDRLDVHTQSLADGDDRMNRMQVALDANTKATLNIEASIKEIVEFFGAMKGAFRVLNWIGALAKPIGAIVAMGAAFWTVWSLWKTGVPPTPPHK